ncbi:MAG: hypothetical protein NTX65_04965 [Ignavibacteriales bacterium]|nr:hypothetical protein [Ignavibacteriales bacterium]
MALLISTSTPENLLKLIKKTIDDKAVDTWTYDKDGDFTHTPPQWKNKAWLRPSIQSNILKFIIVSPENVILTKEVIGVYHGRFIEMLLVHFDEKFTLVSAQK